MKNAGPPVPGRIHALISLIHDPGGTPDVLCLAVSVRAGFSSGSYLSPHYSHELLTQVFHENTDCRNGGRSLTHEPLLGLAHAVLRDCGPLVGVKKFVPQSQVARIVVPPCRHTCGVGYEISRHINVILLRQFRIIFRGDVHLTLRTHPVADLVGDLLPNQRIDEIPPQHRSDVYVLNGGWQRRRQACFT